MAKVRMDFIGSQASKEQEQKPIYIQKPFRWCYDQVPDHSIYTENYKKSCIIKGNCSEIMKRHVAFIFKIHSRLEIISKISSNFNSFTPVQVDNLTILRNILQKLIILRRRCCANTLCYQSSLRYISRSNSKWESMKSLFTV